MRIPNFSELTVISRVTGAALLVAGYLAAGLYIGRSCVSRGYPAWTLPACMTAGLFCALFAGYREMKAILKHMRRK